MTGRQAARHADGQAGRQRDGQVAYPIPQFYLLPNSQHLWLVLTGLKLRGEPSRKACLVGFTCRPRGSFKQLWAIRTAWQC